jgi:hypothetical protein
MRRDYLSRKEVLGSLEVVLATFSRMDSLEMLLAGK